MYCDKCGHKVTAPTQRKTSNQIWRARKDLDFKKYPAGRNTGRKMLGKKASGYLVGSLPAQYGSQFYWNTHVPNCRCKCLKCTYDRKFND